jgi:2-dehydro-3-deoxygalactonokinase
MAADGTPLAYSRGPEGMLHCASAGFATVLQQQLEKLGVSGAAPVLICGMAGARQGWVEAPYLTTPSRLDRLHDGAVRVDTPGDVRILPGIAHRDPASPEVMRGEETQILGAIDNGFSGLVCIPGTHSKWVAIEDGSIAGLTTFMTGELFSVITAHTILTHAIDADALPLRPGAAFDEALSAAASGTTELSSALFRLRAAQLLGFEQRADGAARLSGLLIGSEIAGATKRYGQRPLRLLASGDLGALYEHALRHLGFDVVVADAEQTARRGLMKAAAGLWKERFR